MKKRFLLLFILPLAICPGCFKHWRASKAAGSWQVSKVYIQYFDEDGAKTGDTTIMEPGLLLLDFNDENRNTGPFELIMDSTDIAASTVYQKLKTCEAWERFEHMTFGYFNGSSSYVATMQMLVKELTRTDMKLEYRETDNGMGAGTTTHKEEWLLVRSQ